MFCGNDADSREHLLPKWLQRVLPVDEPAIHFRQFDPAGTDRREWERRPFRETVRVVCSGCNNGWMSALENRAASIMEPLVVQQPSLLDTSAQATLATWAVKTALVFQAGLLDHPEAPLDHFARLRTDGLPPDQITVWLGAHYRGRADPTNSAFVHRPLSIESLDGRIDTEQADADGFGYLNFLAVGGVGFVIVGHRLGNRTKVGYTGALGDALLGIWPPSGVSMTWPPLYMLDRDLLPLLTVPPGGLRSTCGVPPSADRSSS